MPKKIKTTLLSSKDSATYLSCAANTLKLSRTTGQLFSVQAPAYLKIGRTIRYKTETLDDWLNQFEETQNTAQ